jgi:hypothetical protein
MRRQRVEVPPGVDVAQLAGQVRYVGSPEHKTYPSFAGEPHARSDATLCDPRHEDATVLTSWLAEGIREGRVGAPWELHYPRYVWTKQEGIWYEGRLTNAVQGHYKGYALGPSELEDWMTQ